MVDDFLAQAPSYQVDPKAVIAPHAGYVFSGSVAGTAYANLRKRRGKIRRVVLLGPCHRVALRGFAVPSAQAFATPLGLVPIDRQAINSLLKLPGAQVSDAAHAEEHCLETQLPFLQRWLRNFSIVPIVVGAVPARQIDRLLESLWGGEETLIVVSSDLTHFLDYDTARGRDLAACHAIEALDAQQIADDQACGRYAIKGLIERARALDLRVTTLDYKNSGDTAGRDRRDRVVGYGALVLEDSAEARLSDSLRGQLLQSVGRSLEIGLRHGRPPRVAVESFPLPLQACRASFVTLKANGKLRGCVGSVKAHQALIQDVAGSTFKAAFGDRRFEPVSSDELNGLGNGLEASVSILSHPRPMRFETEDDAIGQLQTGIDGVILQEKERRGLFLPQVWESLPDPRAFMTGLKRKAGLPDDHWSGDMALFRYRCESFSTRLDVGKSTPQKAFD